MPSQEAVALATEVIATAADVTGQAVDSDLVQFLASQIDAVVELMEMDCETPSRTKIALWLAKKGLGMTNFSNSLAVRCGGAVLSLGIDAGIAAAEAGTGVGMPAAVLTAIGLLADSYSVYTECRPLAEPAYQAYQNFFIQVVIDFYNHIGLPGYAR